MVMTAFSDSQKFLFRASHRSCYPLIFHLISAFPLEGCMCTHVQTTKRVKREREKKNDKLVGAEVDEGTLGQKLNTKISEITHPLCVPLDKTFINSEINK